MLSNLSRVTQLVGHRTEIWDFHFNTCALSTTLFCKLLYDLLSSFKQLSEVGREGISTASSQMRKPRLEQDSHFPSPHDGHWWSWEEFPASGSRCRPLDPRRLPAQVRDPCLTCWRGNPSRGGAAPGCCNTGGIPEPLRAPRSPLATEVRSDKGHLRSQEIPVTRTPPIKAGTMSSPEIAF